MNKYHLVASLALWILFLVPYVAEAGLKSIEGYGKYKFGADIHQVLGDQDYWIQEDEVLKGVGDEAVVYYNTEETINFDEYQLDGNIHVSTIQSRIVGVSLTLIANSDVSQVTFSTLDHASKFIMNAIIAKGLD